MLRHGLLLCALGLVCVDSLGCASSRPAASAPAASEWRQFAWSDLGVTIDFPQPPREERWVEKTAAGPAPCAVYTADHTSNMSFALSVVDLRSIPLSHESEPTADDIQRIDRAQIEKGGGTVRSARAIAHQGRAGMELIGALQGQGTVTLRSFVAGKRLYTLTVVAAGADTGSQQTATLRFFESLRLSDAASPTG